MIWFGIFLSGLVILVFGLGKALRSRQPDMWMANGGIVTAIGFMGFSRWPEEAIPVGMDQKSAGLRSLRALTWPKVQGTITQSEAVFMGINNSTIIGPAVARSIGGA